MDFMKGLGIGMGVGVALGMLVAPKKKPGTRNLANKAMKVVGEIIDDVGKALS